MQRIFGRFAGITAALLIAASATLTASAAPAYPTSIASTGDSITRAYNTGGFPYIDNPSASWSTGTNSTVRSHYTRLLALQPAISGHAFNDAKTGAKMTDLAGQMTTVAGQHAGYVTVLMGANDVCTSSESTMTSVTSFRAQFTSAMNNITAASPSTLVYVTSIPNIYQLWSVLHTSSSARTVWALFGICKSMLANPSSTAQADVDRRARVLQREVDFNTQLQQVCALYAQCRFDSLAVFNTAFTSADVTTRDYFHPSISGQAKLAAVSWSAGYWGP
ncbi:MAG TPA: SGNH/GDSL hydrolase family protein [Candidatus Limnocylindrales bacterium]